MEYLNKQQIIQKLRWWTLGATVDLGFAVCNWFVSDFYVYLSIVFSACYWWICLLDWLLSFFNYYYFLILIIKKNFFTLINFFLSFFLPFFLSRVADRVLVLWLGIRPEPLRWESRAQDIGPPETSQPNVISIGESSPRNLRLNAKTQLHPTATYSSAGCPMPNN